MSVYKAVKMEIKFLCENELEPKEIVEWVLSALETYCDYEAAEAKIIKSHDSIICKPGDELAEA